MTAKPEYQSIVDFTPGALLPRATIRTGFVEPFRFDSPNQLKAIVLESLAHNASDLFFQPGLPIVASINGSLQALMQRPLDDGEMRNLIKWAGSRDTALTDTMQGISVNARYEVTDPTVVDERGAAMRYGFRANISPIDYLGGTSAQIVMRPIPRDPLNIHQVGLSEELARAACPADGIVYIAGSTGSGKTTTFGAIIRYLMENDTPIKGNLITCEEPIEFTYQNILSKHSIIVQSQVPQHFASFMASNREGMRRKPGLIMIGELRDEETIRASVEASLTGHPVFGTVHATDVASVVRRLISRFPSSERATAIYDIVESARFIMAQRLIKGIDGRRLAAREYLILTPEIRDELANLDDMGRVTARVREFVLSHGHSFVKEAQTLYESGQITFEVARELAGAESHQLNPDAPVSVIIPAPNADERQMPGVSPVVPTTPVVLAPQYIPVAVNLPEEILNIDVTSFAEANDVSAIAEDHPVPAPAPELSSAEDSIHAVELRHEEQAVPSDFAESSENQPEPMASYQSSTAETALASIANIVDEPDRVEEGGHLESSSEEPEVSPFQQGGQDLLPASSEDGQDSNSWCQSVMEPFVTESHEALSREETDISNPVSTELPPTVPEEVVQAAPAGRPDFKTYADYQRWITEEQGAQGADAGSGSATHKPELPPVKPKKSWWQ